MPLTRLEGRGGRMKLKAAEGRTALQESGFGYK